MILRRSLLPGVAMLSAARLACVRKQARTFRGRFGKRTHRVDCGGMNNNTCLHVPFAQLPLEARVLFSIILATIYGPEPPAAAKVLADVEMIWDSENLTLDDFNKPVG
jgi:hypothetical protein